MLQTTKTLTSEEVKETLNRIETKEVVKYGALTSCGILLGGAVKFYSPIVDGLFIGTISSIKNYLAAPFFADPLIGVLPNWVVVLLVLSVITMKVLDIKIEHNDDIGAEFMSIKKSRKENLKRILGGKL
jgi:hypothetical protein